MVWRFRGSPLDLKPFLKPRPEEPPIPRAAAVLGPSYGDSALHASTAHFVVMVKSGSVALSGPSVVEAAIGEVLTDAELGGPDAAEAARNVHMVVNTEADAMTAIAAFLSYLPSSAALPAPEAPSVDPARSPTELVSIVPASSRAAYDMNDVIDATVDAGTHLPWGNGFGGSLLTSFA